jgi:regulator of PEP synthase PpsR (kinase-PPPase family)
MAVNRSYFHLHLVSDATGETLIAVSRAVTSQFQGVGAIEHVYPLIRNRLQLQKAMSEIATAPGIVLYTLVDKTLTQDLELTCSQLGIPSLSVLQPIFDAFQGYLGTVSTSRPGAQHMLNAEYFKRIDALNYTMLHDDGQLTEDLENADVLLVGVSRTSKTPTSIYLANRGIKTANFPLVPGISIPTSIYALKNPLIVGLLASPERIIQIRQNRLLGLNVEKDINYVDRLSVAEEVHESKKLFRLNQWPIIDVSRRSIEETAAAIIDLLKEHNQRKSLEERS